VVRPKRKEEQVDLPRKIREVAWEQTAKEGAASLSLRGIARELNITAPAIYNYYPSRDDLVTELIIDAFKSLGDSQKAALMAISSDDHCNSLRAVARSYREWALQYPQRYQLIFGTPIPGYHAPMDRTQPAAAYSLSNLVDVIEVTRLNGHLHVEKEFTFSDEKLVQFQAWQQIGAHADVQSFSIAVLVWSRVHGLVSLELGNQFPPFGPDPSFLYDYEIENFITQFID
jgi:AcrR family transcriptional regulator